MKRISIIKLLTVITILMFLYVDSQVIVNEESEAHTESSIDSVSQQKIPDDPGGGSVIPQNNQDIETSSLNSDVKVSTDSKVNVENEKQEEAVQKSTASEEKKEDSDILSSLPTEKSPEKLTDNDTPIQTSTTTADQPIPLKMQNNQIKDNAQEENVKEGSKISADPSDGKPDEKFEQTIKEIVTEKEDVTAQPKQPTGNSQTQEKDPQVMPVSVDEKVKVEEGDKGKGSEFETFSEWRQKALAEEEKNKKEQAESGITTPKKRNGKKLNFASKDCGAKILGSNPEAENVYRILTSNKDDYMINPCTVSKKWFVVELCEPIHINEIEIGTFELFSSQPRKISIGVSDRYPVKEYQPLVTHELSEARALQQIEIKSQDNFFVKYVKVELLSHYGNEHFCPLTMLKVYGIPVELDDYDTQHDDDDNNNSNDGDSDDVISNGEESDTDAPKNLFSSAKDTVIKIVKKVLNVEEKAKNVDSKNPNVTSENVTQNVTADNISHNTTSQGSLLPCVPTAQIKKENDSTESEPSENNRPEPPTPQSGTSSVESKERSEIKPDVVDLRESIVTKLEDHEQMPSEQFKPPIVSLIQSGDQKFTHMNIYNKCLYPKKTRRKNRRTLSICGYIMLLTRDLVCIPGQFTLPSTCSSRLRLLSTQDTKTVISTNKVIEVTVDSQPVVTQTEVLPSQSTKLDEHVPCFVPTPSSMSEPSLVETKSDSSMQLEHSDSQSTGILKELETGAKEPIKTDTVMVSEMTTASSVMIETTLITKSPFDDGFYEMTSNGKDTTLEPSSSVIDLIVTSVEETPVLTQTESLITSLEKDLITAASSLKEDIKSDTKANLPKVNVGSIGTSSQTEDSHPSQSVEFPSEHISSTGDSLASTVAKDDQIKASPTEVVEEGNFTDTVIAADQEKNQQKPLNLVKVPVMPFQKRETAIMRLTNRIKILESNVSLSSRFLDQMTQKFRKQSEEMYRLLNARFDNVTKEAEIRDLRQQEQINVLEHRLENLTDLVVKLHDDMTILNKQVTDRQMVWTSIEVVILCVIFLVCLRRGKSSIPEVPREFRHLIENMPPALDTTSNPRRNSYSGAPTGKTHPGDISNLQKHNSESALVCDTHVSCSHDRGPFVQCNQLKDVQKRRKRKKKIHVNEMKSAKSDKTEELQVLSDTNVNAAGLLFGTNQEKDISCEKQQSKSSSGFWPFSKPQQKKSPAVTDTSYNQSITQRRPKPHATTPLISQKNHRKGNVNQADISVSSKTSRNGHCMYSNMGIENISSSVFTEEIHRPSSSRPPDKNKTPSVAFDVSAKKKFSHKRASSADFSPKKSASNAWSHLFGWT